MKNIPFRVGHGFDVHAFKEGDGFFLAGVRIPFTKSLEAFSDGDVLFHSLASAILGSMALGDLGTLYPNGDDKYRNIRSQYLVEDAYQRVQVLNYEISNLDITIICEKPKIQPYFEQMRISIAQTLNLSIDLVSVKAVTTEKLGFLGRVEGIAVLSYLMVSLINMEEIML